MFDPTMFFLVLLPPIIFESGYSLHKGNFFQNLGSIIIFAVIGTAISAVVVGGGLFILGKANVVYQLTIIESFAFGSLISAVDPVATLAIFQALDVDPILHMLVFGESVLNDAVSIVMTNTILYFQKSGDPPAQAVATAIGHFLLMFIGSSAIGIVSALLSALLLKYVNLRATPSLELGTVIAFAYAPYAVAESLKLSGIMAILFCGIVMSHYTHFSLSPSTQMTVQHVFRTMAFMCETCVFAYLGLAIFGFQHSFHASLILWSLFLILIGRAVNIFPLSLVMNRFRTVKISVQTQFIIWFSGLRGAIAFALSLHLPFDHETRSSLISTTLIIVLCTIIIFGGSALPMLKIMKSRYAEKLVMSKTEEQGSAVDATQALEHTEQPSVSRLVTFDKKYLMPFFRRKYTSQEVKDCQIEMQKMTNQWYNGVTLIPTSDQSESEEEEEEEEEIEVGNPHQNDDRNGNHDIEETKA
ncbi:sodium/hydrogen exchanger 8-like isoform X2 [Oscarella lobularis]